MERLPKQLYHGTYDSGAGLKKFRMEFDSPNSLEGTCYFHDPLNSNPIKRFHVEHMRRAEDGIYLLLGTRDLDRGNFDDIAQVRITHDQRAEFIHKDIKDAIVKKPFEHKTYSPTG